MRLNKFLFYTVAIALIGVVAWFLWSSRNYSLSSDERSLITERLVEISLNGKVGFIDPLTQAMVVKPKYDFVVGNFDSQGLIVFSNNNEYGLISAAGKVVAYGLYDDISTPVSRGLYQVYKNKKGGYIDSSGNVVVPLVYDSLTPFYHGFASVCRESKCGLIDEEGKLILPELYEQVLPPVAGREMIEFKINGKWGVANTEGMIVVEHQFDEIQFVGHQLYAVRNGNKWGILDPHRGMIVGYEYDQIGKYFDYFYSSIGHYKRVDYGLAPVQKGDRYGYINPEGALVVPLVFDIALSFRGGLAKVSRGGEWFHIDKDGKVVFIPGYSSEKIGSTAHGYHVLVKKDENLEGDDFIYLNSDGGQVERKEAAFGFDAHGLSEATNAGMWGYINKKYEYVVLPKYDSVGSFNSAGYSLVTRGGGWVVIDIKGNELLYSDSVCGVEVVRSARGELVYPEHRSVSDICSEAEYKLDNL